MCMNPLSLMTASDLSSLYDAFHGSELLDEAHRRIMFNIRQSDTLEEAAQGPLPELLSGAGGAPGVSTVIVDEPGAGRQVIVLSNYDERMPEELGIHIYRQLRAATAPKDEKS